MIKTIWKLPSIEWRRKHSSAFKEEDAVYTHGIEYECEECKNATCVYGITIEQKEGKIPILCCICKNYGF